MERNFSKNNKFKVKFSRRIRSINNITLKILVIGGNKSITKRAMIAALEDTYQSYGKYIEENK